MIARLSFTSMLVVALMGALLLAMAPRPKIELTTYAQVAESVPSERVLSAANVEWSVGHQESQGVISSLLGLTEQQGILQQKGDGRSNGSVRIFAGFDADPQLGTPRVNFAILYVFGLHMKFAVVSAPLLDGPGTNGFRKIGNTSKYFDPKSLVWTCAWIMASNGTGSKKLTPPENLWFSAGEGWAAWAVISQRYNLIVPVMEIPLPPMPPGLK